MRLGHVVKIKVCLLNGKWMSTICFWKTTTYFCTVTWTVLTRRLIKKMQVRFLHCLLTSHVNMLLLLPVNLSAWCAIRYIKPSAEVVTVEPSGLLLSPNIQKYINLFWWVVCLYCVMTAVESWLVQPFAISVPLTFCSYKREVITGNHNIT